MVWASCEVQDSVVQTAVREKWELSVIPWYYHFLFSPYLCLSLPQGHLLLTAILPYYKCCCLSAELLGCSLSLHLSLMFALLPLPLISHRSCLLLSTPKPFIRLSALTYQSLFPVLSCPIPSLSVLGTVFSGYLQSISHWIHSTLSFSLEVDKCEVGRFVGCFCYCYCCHSFWCHYPMKTQTESHLGVMKRKSPWLTTWQPIEVYASKNHLHRFTIKPYKKHWGGTMVQWWHLMITVVLWYG